MSATARRFGLTDGEWFGMLLLVSPSTKPPVLATFLSHNEPLAGTDQTMAKSSENDSQTCPLCGESLTSDNSGTGFVRHKASPRGASIFDDKAKIQAMRDSGDLKSNFKEYFESTGYCPFQQGQRD